MGPMTKFSVNDCAAVPSRMRFAGVFDAHCELADRSGNEVTAFSILQIATDPAVCATVGQQAMHEPVLVSDGHTYERAAIEDWVSKYAFSPMTGAELVKVDGKVLLMPNHAFGTLLAYVKGSESL